MWKEKKLITDRHFPNETTQYWMLTEDNTGTCTKKKIDKNEKVPSLNNIEKLIANNPLIKV